jgi:hypothetical protein
MGEAAHKKNSPGARAESTMKRAMQVLGSSMLLAFAPMASAHETEDPVALKVASGFAALAGSEENALALAHAIHDGAPARLSMEDEASPAVPDFLVSPDPRAAPGGPPRRRDHHAGRQGGEPSRRAAHARRRLELGCDRRGALSPRELATKPGRYGKGPSGALFFFWRAKRRATAAATFQVTFDISPILLNKKKLQGADVWRKTIANPLSHKKNLPFPELDSL